MILIVKQTGENVYNIKIPFQEDITYSGNDPERIIKKLMEEQKNK